MFVVLVASSLLVISTQAASINYDQEKCKAAALALGYVKLNNVSYRKSYSDFYESYKEDKSKIDEEGFWEDYRTHKNNNSDMYQTFYKPLVRNYFKTKGKLEKMSLNYAIQGTSAEITKYAAIMQPS